MDPGEVVLVPTVGSMTGAEMEKSMRLFADKVLHRLADIRAGAGAAQ
jgi:hypothetical protein